MEKTVTHLYCSKCGAKIKYSLTDHWRRVHWKKRTKLYKLEYLYEGK